MALKFIFKVWIYEKLKGYISKLTIAYPSQLLQNTPVQMSLSPLIQIYHFLPYTYWTVK